LKQEIKNRRSLVSVGNRWERATIIDSINGALRSVHPTNLIQKELLVKSGILYVKASHRKYDLTKFRNIIVVGGGKASGYMAQELERKLGDYIDEGCVNILEGTKKKFRTRKIFLHEASHPLPNNRSIVGTKRIVSLLREADSFSLVICLISGGGSALVSFPARGITLSEKIKTTKLLLNSGADIEEINCVRKHVSSVKGGQLVKEGNGATFLSLIISDVVGDNVESIASGLTAADSTTFCEAKQILLDKKIFDKVPKAVRNRIQYGCDGKISETPKPGDPIFDRVSNVIIGNNKIACNELSQAIKRKMIGEIKIDYLGSRITGEASWVAKGIVSKMVRFSKLSKKPYSALVWGGETTVTVKGNGIGGRNQEEALSALEEIGELNNHPSITLAFIGTDGIDGKTNAAGALVDNSTFVQAKKLGLLTRAYLDKNDSNTFFRRVRNSLIITGPTGTNVNDIGVAIAREDKRQFPFRSQIGANQKLV
jgi:glycerate 2-kinase